MSRWGFLKSLSFPYTHKKKVKNRNDGRFTRSSACAFHRGTTNYWGTAGGTANSDVYARRQRSEEYKRAREQRLVEEQRSKEICFNYVEKGQLLWWQIVEYATAVDSINNPYADKMNIRGILIVEIKNRSKWERHREQIPLVLLSGCFSLHDTEEPFDCEQSREDMPIILTWLDM